MKIFLAPCKSFLLAVLCASLSMVAHVVGADEQSDSGDTSVKAKVEHAADKTRTAVNKAADKTKQGLTTAAEHTEHALHKAADKTQQALEKTGTKIKKVMVGDEK